eukprot:694801-Prymnesium_polylepis.1
MRRRVIVQALAPTSLLAGRGVGPGAILVSVNGAPVSSSLRAKALLGSSALLVLCFVPSKTRIPEATTVRDIENPPPQPGSRSPGKKPSMFTAI